jgi:Cu-processing system permease protein
MSTQQGATGAVTMRIDGAGAAMSRTLAVTGNTLREAGRNRIFMGLAVIALLLIVLSMVLSELALTDQKARLVQDFGLFFVPLLGELTAVILGVVLLHKEIEKKTLYAILPKPIRRGEFLLGKFLGLAVLLLGQEVLLALCWMAVLLLRGGEVTPEVIAALGLGYVEILLATAIATFFSALSTPILSGVFTTGLLIAGRISYVVKDLMAGSSGVFAEVPAMRAFGKVLVTVVPDLSTFNIADEILLGWSLDVPYLLAAVGYGLAWTVVFVVFGLLAFERRDLT